MKKLLLAGSLSLVLNAQIINVTNNWQLVGAKEDINTSIFDNSCVDFVWGYDSKNNSWKLHIANGKTYNLPNNISALTTIKDAEGFWIKGNGNCSVDTDIQNISKLTGDTITASQYYNFVGDSLIIEYSGKFEGSNDSDNNGDDNLDPGYMEFSSLKIGVNNQITLKGIEFSWDDDSKKHDTNIYDVDGNLSGTIANGNVFYSFKNIEDDITTGTGKATIITNGDTQIFFDKEELNGKIKTYAEKDIFISGVKVTNIAGIEVGSENRNVYKVKCKVQYGQMQGNKFIASGDGYDGVSVIDSKYEDNMTKWVNDKIANSETADGGANVELVFAENGKFKNKYTNEIVPNVYWKIEGNVLKVRAYDDYNKKIVGTKLYTNWVGDMEWHYINITPQEANKILKVLAPNENLTVE